MAEADEHVALVQLRATLSALSAAAQLETTTQREIFAAVSDAMGGATFNAATRAVMKAELEGFLIRLTQSQSGAPSGGGEAAVPAKRPRKAAQPQRRKKAASSGEDEESEPSAEASEGDEEASDSDFEETSGAQSEALPLFCTAAHAGPAQRMTRASRGARRARRLLRPRPRRKRRRLRPRLRPKPRLRKAAHARPMQLRALPLLLQLPPSQPRALRRRLVPRRRPLLRAQRAQEGRQRPRSWLRVLPPCSLLRRRG
jgi:hypothetical protein